MRNKFFLWSTTALLLSASHVIASSPSGEDEAKVNTAAPQAMPTLPQFTEDQHNTNETPIEQAPARLQQELLANDQDDQQEKPKDPFDGLLDFISKIPPESFRTFEKQNKSAHDPFPPIPSRVGNGFNSFDGEQFIRNYAVVREIERAHKRAAPDNFEKPDPAIMMKRKSSFEVLAGHIGAPRSEAYNVGTSGGFYNHRRYGHNNGTSDSLYNLPEFFNNGTSESSDN